MYIIIIKRPEGTRQPGRNSPCHTIPSLLQLLLQAEALQSEGRVIVQELCESRGGRHGLSVLTSLLVSVDVKNY